jgi:flagellar basal body-associated protein FliL
MSDKKRNTNLEIVLATLVLVVVLVAFLSWHKPAVHRDSATNVVVVQTEAPPAPVAQEQAVALEPPTNTISVVTTDEKVVTNTNVPEGYKRIKVALVGTGFATKPQPQPQTNTNQVSQ